MSNLKGKTAIVTGATSGIGKAIALQLISEGVFCYLIGRHFEALETAVTGNKNHAFLKADLSKDDDINKIVSQVEKNEIDFLIHAAGVISLGELEQMETEALDWQYKINLRAPFVLTKMLLPKIRLSKGTIFFVNSTAGLNAWERVGSYAATKHGLRAMTDSLRNEVSKDNIRVTSLFLGSVDTPMQKKVQELSGSSHYDASKFMKAESIAETVSFILNLPAEVAVTEMTLRQNTQ